MRGGDRAGPTPRGDACRDRRSSPDSGGVGAVRLLVAPRWLRGHLGGSEEALEMSFVGPRVATHGLQTGCQGSHTASPPSLLALDAPPDPPALCPPPRLPDPRGARPGAPACKQAWAAAGRREDPSTFCRAPCQALEPARWAGSPKPGPSVCILERGLGKTWAPQWALPPVKGTRTSRSSDLAVLRGPRSRKGPLQK